MSSTYTRVMATLSNGQSIYVYNMDSSAKLEAPVVLATLDATRENAQGNLEYRLSDASTGWFASIRAEDSARLDATALLEGYRLAQVTPLRSFSIKDFQRAVKGGAQ